MHLWLLALTAATAQPVELDCHLGGADEELRFRITLDENARTVRQQQSGGSYDSLDPAVFTPATITVVSRSGTLMLDRTTMRLTRRVPLAFRNYAGSCDVAPVIPAALARSGGGAAPKAR